MIEILDIVHGNAFDAAAEKARGTRGVIIKAGQGQLEYTWLPYALECNAAGLPWGTYWLCDARYSPESHKAAIRAAFPTGYFGALGLWLDCEKPKRDMTDAAYWDCPYAGYKPIESIWRGMQAYTGKYPGTYTSWGAWNLIFAGCPIALQEELAAKSLLWTAQYEVGAPRLYGRWTRYFLWQYREGPDYSIFNGTEAEFHDWAVVPPPVEGEPMFSGVVTTDGLRIRSGPGTSNSIIGSLKKGDQVIASEKSLQWWHLMEINGAVVTQPSWASGDYIQQTSETPNEDIVVDITARINGETYQALDVPLVKTE